MPVARKITAALAAATAMLAASAPAHAHGGMAGPDEIAPPLLTSIVLGFVCYWLVILWPSSKSKDDAPGGTVANKSHPAKRRLAARARDEQDSPRFRKIAGRGRP